MEIAIAPLVALVAPYIGYALLALVVVLSARLPAPAIAVFKQMHAEKLICEAINFGINSVEGAAAGRTISVGLANPVAALAVRYALSHAQPWLETALGDPEKLAEKVWSRLNLDPNASLPDFGSIAEEARSKA